MQLGLGFGMSSHALDCGPPALQGLGFGSSQGAHAGLQGPVLLLSAASGTVEFY